MTRLAPPDAARLYVELSNAGDLDAALAMFAADASYRSSQVGSWSGRDEIAEMMRSFFGRFVSPHWEVTEYRESGPDEAEFAFVMTARNASTGETITRRGVERIAFNAAGLIRRVAVEVEVEE